MQKFEYQTIDSQGDDEQILRLLNREGENGWELVAVIPLNIAPLSFKNMRLIFIRSTR